MGICVKSLIVHIVTSHSDEDHRPLTGSLLAQQITGSDYV